jgi:hypothetical protein
MRLKSLFAILLFIVFLFTGSVIGSDEFTQNLETKILESFDEDPTSRWIARGSKFATEGYPKVTEVATYPTSLFGYQVEENVERKVLGVRSKFDYKGYNYVEIMPVKPDDGTAEEKDIVYIDDAGKGYVSDPIPIPGRIKLFDVWVWGSNHSYYLDAHFQDSWGVSYVLRLGDLNFAGWKNLSVEIPDYIAQSSLYIPQYRPLTFVKFVIWTRPSEKVDDYYIYFDQIKILTDTYVTKFDGDDLADPNFSNEIWSNEE